MIKTDGTHSTHCATKD